MLELFDSNNFDSSLLVAERELRVARALAEENEQMDRFFAFLRNLKDLKDLAFRCQ